ncbi:hypothetical protein TNCV_2126801 [Trichonephila clavipes]|nr:hypothetical protein TNCV_2126801 [Trichonephila clavipes]
MRINFGVQGFFFLLIENRGSLVVTVTNSWARVTSLSPDATEATPCRGGRYALNFRGSMSSHWRESDTGSEEYMIREAHFTLACE